MLVGRTAGHEPRPSHPGHDCVLYRYTRGHFFFSGASATESGNGSTESLRPLTWVTCRLQVFSSSSAFAAFAVMARSRRDASPARPDADHALEKGPRDAVTHVQGNGRLVESVAAARLDPWSKTSLQLYMILFVAALNATASGFDGVNSRGRTVHWPRLPARQRVLMNGPVHLQLHQRHGPIPALLSPKRARLQHGHVGLPPLKSVRLHGPDLTVRAASS